MAFLRDTRKVCVRMNSDLFLDYYRVFVPLFFALRVACGKAKIFLFCGEDYFISKRTSWHLYIFSRRF